MSALLPDGHEFPVEWYVVPLRIFTADRYLEKMDAVRPCTGRIDKEAAAGEQPFQTFPELLVHCRVERMSRSHQHGIDVCVLLKVMLVEGDLSVGRFRFPDLLDGTKTFRTQICQNMFDAPKPIGPRFDPETHFPGGCNELRFDISRHEPTFFDFEIAALESAEVHVTARESDARSFLIFFELGWIDAINLIEVFFKSFRIVGRVSEHVGEIYIVQRQHLTDHIENATFEGLVHLIQFFQKPMENPAFDNRLSVLGIRCDKVESVTIPVLSDAVNAAQPLLQSGRVPGHVVVDHQVAELEVDAFAGGLCRDADLSGGSENLLRSFALMGVHAAMNFTGAETPSQQMIAHIAQGVAVLREDQKLPPAVLQFQELCLAEARLQCGQLGITCVFPNTPGLLHQLLEGDNFRTQLFKFQRRCILINQLVADGVVKIVLVLLGIREPSL
ncbi:MAG TPA: hypothetical protein DCZ97_13600 [Syntrophus sp. (in: bacteria)]|nr:hypothetical protein [Syntrophus sp. (in: bacteria)]